MVQAPSTTDSSGWRWSLPEGLNIPIDPLRYRLDIHDENILLHEFTEEGVQSKVVSAMDIARAFAGELRWHSGILPQDCLWWSLGPEGEEVALWRQPKVWPVALQLEAFKPPQRFRLPMPGLVFLCSRGRPPRVYAARKCPTDLSQTLYHAPLFNVFQDGRTCPGTHKYPEETKQIPESFFTSFFSVAGDHKGRSRRHSNDLLLLWQELDGKRRFPLKDLMPIGTVQEIIERNPARRET